MSGGDHHTRGTQKAQNAAGGASGRFQGSGEAGWLGSFGGLTLSPWIALVSRVILGGVFLYAGVTKTLDAGALAASIRSYELGLPEWFVSLSARGLPLLEVLIGLYLIVGLFTRPTTLVTGFLMLVFFLALVQGAARGLQIDCGCFGGTGGGTAQSGGSNLVSAAVRDLALIALCTQLYLAAPGKLSLDSRLGLSGISARGPEGEPR